MNTNQRQLVDAVKLAIETINRLIEQKDKEFQEAVKFNNEMNPAEDMMRVSQGAVDFNTVLLEYQHKLKPYFEKIIRLDEEINKK